MTQLDPKQVVILSQRRRICAQVESHMIQDDSPPRTCSIR
jgi:hypothetical protein